MEFQEDSTYNFIFSSKLERHLKREGEKRHEKIKDMDIEYKYNKELPI